MGNYKKNSMTFSKTVTVCGALNLESVDRRKYILGGAGYYASAAASKYAKTKIISCIGDDVEYHNLERIMRKIKVNFKFINIYKGKTFKWEVLLSNDKNRIQNEKIEYGNYLENIPKKNNIYSSIVLLASSHPKMQHRVLKCIKNKKAIIIFDTKKIYIINRIREILQILKDVDILLLNKEEYRAFINKCNLKDIKKIFKKNNRLKIIITKLGRNGGIIIHNNGVIVKYNSIKCRQIHNSIGAGDVFAGTIAGLLARKNKFSIDYITKIIQIAARNSSDFITEDGRKKILCLNQ